MRTDIYYWKCDSPLSVADKKRTFFADKYDRDGLTETVAAACRRVFGGPIDEVRPLRVDGNHLAFLVRHGGEDYFFRADDGNGADDYMLAESAVMALAREAGVPVPRVTHTDVSRTRCPYRFQLMECCPDPSLNVHWQAGTLDAEAVARQLGQYLQRLHSVRVPGFGFVDTDALAASGRLRGLDASYPEYFHKRLDDHLDYLHRAELLPAAVTAAIRREFARHASRLDREQGVLVHRDMALWNVLGTPDSVTAVIDWDDAVSGDPADDVGILGCFHDDAFMTALLAGYWDDAAPPAEFMARVWLHTLRNMLWKTKIRHSLGYFEKAGGFFLNTPGVQGSLREHTLRVLDRALTEVTRLETP